ncbi:MAG: nucleotidyltransferase domain-containing protein [Candidatus Bathyarchaeota archaeon]|nr:MAG: nucleotidyltransferase domain-containing protein [Candidatus Bathyarchaeota archaeon]
MTMKPVRHAERLEIRYDAQHWLLLKRLRSKAVKLMEILRRATITAIIHGSIARGDVNPGSDVDVFIPNPPSSFIIETALERADVSTNRRLIVQATPYYAVKGYIEIDKQQVISFPLVKMRRIERDFYPFGGASALSMLRGGRRVKGVDKRLMLIEPTKSGHIESSIVGREGETAKLLHISIETVFDRVHALLRRDKVGRTGVFITRELTSDETFEMVLRKLAEAKPEVRRRLKLYEK